jgi:hypothetical protein
VLAPVDIGIGVADLDPDAAADPLRRIRLGVAIPLDALDVEADADAPLAGPLIDCREIAENAVADVVALGIDPDRLGDGQGAVRADIDVAAIVEDPLAGGRAEIAVAEPVGAGRRWGRWLGLGDPLRQLSGRAARLPRRAGLYRALSVHDRQALRRVL